MIVVGVRERGTSYLLFDPDYSPAFGGCLVGHFGLVSDSSVAQAHMVASFRFSKMDEIELVDVVEQLDLESLVERAA